MLKGRDEVAEPLLALMRRLRPQVRGELGWTAAPVPVARLRPADARDVAAALSMADDERVPVAFGQMPACVRRRAPSGLLLIDDGGLSEIPDLDPARRLVAASPGVTVAALNHRLAPHGLWLPVLAARALHARLGALAGLDAGGLGPATMADRLPGIDAVLSDGTRQLFGPFGEASAIRLGSGRAGQLVSALFGIAHGCQDDIARHWPPGRRAVGGYLLDSFHPRPQRRYTADGTVNLAHLLAGSRGSLAWFSHLHLRPVPRPAVMRWALVGFDSVAAALAGLRGALAAQPVVLQLLDVGGMQALRGSAFAEDQALWGARVRADGPPEGRAAQQVFASVRTGMSAAPVPAAASGPEDGGCPAAGWLVCCAGEDEAGVQARLRALLDAAGVGGAAQRVGVVLAAGSGTAQRARLMPGRVDGVAAQVGAVEGGASGLQQPSPRIHGADGAQVLTGHGAVQSASLGYPVWQQLLDVETAPHCWPLADHVRGGSLAFDDLLADGAQATDSLLLPPLPLPALATQVCTLTGHLRAQGVAVRWRGRLLSGELIVQLQPGGAVPAQRTWPLLLQAVAPLIEKRWSPALQAAFAQVKAQFDPHGVLLGAG